MTNLPQVNLPKIGEIQFKLFVGEDSGTIRARSASREIGYIVWDSPEPDIIELCDIMIHNAADRGHGLGNYLVNALINYAKEIGMTKVIGQTAENDPPVHDFYRKLGFDFPCPPERGSIMFELTILPHNT
ncbi:MAG: GNAT family N-acetyltransferase [Verrucomicrobiota bacterium]|nr:GNAT family N-acetyltransferase [Pseudomonadota bacterium]MEC8330259.1 GNAT family N-acetyltransferase [Verrucomicrobiota bacterium]